MEAKTNIRRRRKNRLKELRRQMSPPDATGGRDSGHFPVRMMEPRISSAAGDDSAGDKPQYVPREDWNADPRMQDPEYVWKHRHELRKADGNGGQDFPDNARFRSGGYKRFLLRMTVSVVLFGAVWGIDRTDVPWAFTVKKYVQAALTEDFDFSEAANWYAQHFQGSPSLIPAFGEKGNGPAEKVTAPLNNHFQRPVNGRVETAFSSNHPAVILNTLPGVNVNAMGTGRVVFVGDRDESGLTVIVQHADGYRSIYGLLAESKVARNDWIEAGEPLGAVSGMDSSQDARLYFAVQRNNQYINPADVVKFE